MNKRCTCEPVQITRRNGCIETKPGLLTEGCPVHWAHGRRDWTGNECSAPIPGLARYKRQTTETHHYRIERKHGEPYEFDRVEERWETTAEVQRRLYEEARA